MKGEDFLPPFPYQGTLKASFQNHSNTCLAKLPEHIHKTIFPDVCN